MQTFYFKNWQECLAMSDLRENHKKSHRYTIAQMHKNGHDLPAGEEGRFDGEPGGQSLEG